VIQVRVRLYAELNEHLPAPRRQREFVVSLETSATVRDLLASLGVSAHEVDLVLVGGSSVELSQPLQDGDRVAAFPVFERLDVSRVSRVPEAPLRRTRLLLDPGRVRLAVALRLLGFDACCRADRSPASLEPARSSGRILASVEPAPASAGLTHVLPLRPGTWREQLDEILQSLSLEDALTPGTRCLRCAGPLPGEAPSECPRCRARFSWNRSRARRVSRVRETALRKRPPET